MPFSLPFLGDLLRSKAFSDETGESDIKPRGGSVLIAPALLYSPNHSPAIVGAMEASQCVIPANSDIAGKHGPTT